MICSVKKFLPFELSDYECEELKITSDLKVPLSRVISNLALLCLISRNMGPLKEKDIDKKSGSSRFPVTKLKDLYFLLLREVHVVSPRPKLKRIDFLLGINKALEKRGMFVHEIASEEKLDSFDNTCTRAKRTLANIGFGRIIMRSVPFQAGLYPISHEIDETASSSFTSYVEKLRRGSLLKSKFDILEIDIDNRAEALRIQRGLIRKQKGQPKKLHSNPKGGFYRSRLIAPDIEAIKNWYFETSA